MENIPELFGSMVFNETVMKERLPKDAWKSLQKTLKENTPLEPGTANAVAHAMKEWAVENGATHFTHWFQPMTGITAEKHDSFIQPAGDGKVIMRFSGKELIKGEPDASSFPNGGLRATFEARGYTAWDPTSYAFLKDGSLCIPTAFCSYNGEALDKKTPLLRSMEILNKEALRVVKLFGTEANRVNCTVGAEQEYFLIDEKVYNERPDLKFCGRTLFGSKPPKGQELDDHYFGAIKPRVSAYMKELDSELWKLGILSKTKHNEVAPSQHEMAPIFTTTNLATDQNQIVMETMKKVARRNGLVCLLHEKPYAGLNGSGKHNNWSISTDTGVNLLEPGDSPSENAQFLLILAAVIKAVDKHQDLLRMSVASAGNDHRLGANEAPPAIISMFVGSDLGEILDSIVDGTTYSKKAKELMTIGVDVLPSFAKDTTDRNRTSSFAFTGNKFEFRSLGSSQSLASPNIMLNTAVAETMAEFADILEKAGTGESFTKALNDLVKTTLKEHMKIVFNGNGYDDSWIGEAEKRGLLNLRRTTDALPCLVDSKNIAFFEKFGVYSKAELESRYEILMENYSKELHIEALTSLEMIKRDILPAVTDFLSDTAMAVENVKSVSKSACKSQLETIETVSALSDTLYEKTEKFDSIMLKANSISDVIEQACYYADTVITAMVDIRSVVDELETIVGSDYWPYPSYGEMLFSV
ncbi:MAG: glutamine synthetase type III [Treponema sp. CETP13]|nr:MAG: glutamine synthetase type III [Treponema sp. CETP13]